VELITFPVKFSHKICFGFSFLGPTGTPYANGCFFFDFHLNDYPNSPPRGQFLTTGGSKVRFNPNLYACGKICLSLLGTWNGPQWIPNQSTFLQVLISIQGLILVDDPYFNEPGFETFRKKHQELAKQYNKDIRRQTLIWAIEDPLRRALEVLEGKKTNPNLVKSNYNNKVSTKSLEGYPEFAVVVVMHFAHQADEIEAQLQEWTTQDPILKGNANKIRSLLKRVVEQNLKLSKQETKDLKPAASSTTSNTCSENRSSERSSAKKANIGTDVIEVL
jgi:ubiquitin-protein ligase